MEGERNTKIWMCMFEKGDIYINELEERNVSS